MTTEENLHYVAAKEVTGKEREDVLDDLKKEMLEKQCNWYLSKVFFVKKAHGLETVKNAVCKFIEEQFGLKGKDFFDKVLIGDRYDSILANSLATFERSLEGSKELEENDSSKKIKIVYDNNVFIEISEQCNGAILLKTSIKTSLKTRHLMERLRRSQMDTMFYHDIYNYLEEYLEKIGENRCPSCGEEITGKGKFCSNCGATL